MDPQVLMNATEAFVASMRRSWITMNREGDCPVKPTASYPPLHRQALMRAIKTAIEAANAPKEKQA